MAGSWAPLTNQPGFNTGTMILLTDGRVMVQEEGTAHWHALTPDSTGSYVNGSWSALHDMSFWRRYYVSAVLRDGRVLVCGGEQTGDTGDTNKGEIYDPTTDVWTPMALPPWPNVGDAACCTLPDGRVLIGALLSGDCIIYDPVTNSWTPTGAQSGRTNEETWILLPDGTIVAPQCFPPFGSQKYIIATGVWQDEGALPVTIIDPVMSEIGPGMLLYNGKAIFFGSANSDGFGETVLYQPPSVATSQGTWTAGPHIPQVGGQTIVSNDCPATLLPNGKVLFTGANFAANAWGTPVLFFEYDPVANAIAQVPTPPNNATYPYPDPGSAGVYWSRMMLLPTGQVLFSASSPNVQCYEPDGGPVASWRPTITTIHPNGSGSFTVTGTQLNGLSQANIYGDDCYPATNYPLVRLTGSDGSVYYCRTSNFSTMAVGASGTQSATFSITGVPWGPYELEVVANGISSATRSFTIGLLKPLVLDIPLKAVVENIFKWSEGDRFKWIEQVIDPEIIRLRTSVRELRNEVGRLNSLISAKDLPRVGAQIAKQAHANEDRPATN